MALMSSLMSFAAACISFIFSSVVFFPSIVLKVTTFGLALISVKIILSPKCSCSLFMWIQPYATFCSVFQFLFHEVNEIINGDLFIIILFKISCNLQECFCPLINLRPTEFWSLNWSLLCLPTEPLASVSLYAEINTASLAASAACRSCTCRIRALTNYRLIRSMLSGECPLIQWS